MGTELLMNLIVVLVWVASCFIGLLVMLMGGNVGLPLLRIWSSLECPIGELSFVGELHLEVLMVVLQLRNLYIFYFNQIT